MSYKVSFEAADVQWQILMLQEFPKIANKHFYPAMHRATSAVYSAVYPNIPEDTGQAKSEFRKAVSGNGLNITGRVGWFGFVEGWYINFAEYGARAHPYAAGSSVRTKKKARIFSEYMSSPNRISGPKAKVFMYGGWKSVEIHPALPARRFLKNGFDQSIDEVNTEMFNASEEVVNELAKKG